MHIGELLKQEGLITAEQLQQAMQDRSGDASITDVLIDQLSIDENRILELLAREFHCEVLHAVDDCMLDAELVADLPVEFARTRHLLPIRHEGEIALLTNDPAAAIDHTDLSLLLGVEPQPLLAPRALIRASIEKCYFHKTESTEDMIDRLDHSTDRPSSAASGDEADLLRSSDQAPVTQLVNQILLEALKENASDIHIEPFEQSIRVRFRLDGVLYDRPAPPKALESSLSSRLKIMAKLDIAEKRLPQDGMARVKVGEREIDVRVSTVPVAEGERIVLRLLRHDTAHLTLSELGMGGKLLDRFKQLLAEPHGVIWVTGPTGSGKTTTLYAALQELDTDRTNVLTIEDPIEYQLAKIGQIAVKPKIGLTFSKGLRHILRQDPDIILVGETRDMETAEIVVQASLTGHLVFSTLHTNDALSAMTRLSDMGVERFLVAESTRAVMAQRLVRRLCTDCRQAYTPESTEVDVFGEAGKAISGKTIYRAEGCANCREGFTGRIGIFELHLLSSEMQEAIRTKGSLTALRKIAERDQTPALIDDAIEKVANGLTSLDEIHAALGRT